jgi:hypothetical protein
MMSLADGRGVPRNKTAWDIHQADIQRTQLEALRRSLQLTNQIMSGRDSSRLAFSNSKGGNGNNGGMGHGFAITAGDVITINIDKIPDPTSPEGVANILGLDYHELSHMLLTPADRGIILNHYKPTQAQVGVSAARAISKNFWPAYGVLEEARVETLMGAKYNSLRKYFAYPVLSLLVKRTTHEDLPTRHLLLHGRRYLPRKLRDTFREFFEKQYSEKDARRVEAIIDEYRFIALTNNERYEKAAGLINDFACILDDLGIDPPQPEHGGDGQQSQGSPNKGGNKTQTRQDQEQMSKQAKKESDEQDEEEEQDPQHDGSGFNDDSEGGEDNDNESGSSSDSGDSQQGDDEESGSDSSAGSSSSRSGKDSKKSGGGSSGDDGGNSPGRDKSGKGSKGKSKPQNNKGPNNPVSGRPSAGTGSGGDQIEKSQPKPDTYNRGALAGVMKDMLNDLMDDNEFKSEVQRYQNTMGQSSDGLASVLQKTPEKSPQHLREVTPEMFARSGMVSSELRMLWAKMEPGWNYGIEDGPRLNMNNAATATEPEDYDSIYDDWSPGQQENAGLEVVIMGDRSGSMASKFYEEDFNYYSLTEEQRKKLNEAPTLAGMVSMNIWELMFALQEVEAKVTVVTYDGYCYTFFERGETVNGNGWYELKAAGGTDPADAFQEARRILTQSEMPNKLLVNFTDGGWGTNPDRIKEALDPLYDTVKVAALIGGYKPEQFQYRESFDVVEATRGDILPIMAKAVTEIMQRSSDR